MLISDKINFIIVETALLTGEKTITVVIVPKVKVKVNFFLEQVMKTQKEE